jgi:hypothetical protein
MGHSVISLRYGTVHLYIIWLVGVIYGKLSRQYGKYWYSVGRN